MDETNLPRAVIFDCDGVIVDSEPQTLALIREDIAGRGFLLTDAQLHSLIGGTMADVARRARALGAELPEDWVEIFYRRLYAHLAEGTALIPGIPALLDRLARAGIAMGIGSNGSEEKMNVTLGQHPEVRARFDVILSGQTLARPKPAPDLYLEVARRLGHPPEACVVIEDSATGARAGIAAGMRVYGYAPEGNPALAETGASLFASMSELPGLIGVNALSA
ncbi:HAD family hydrolase [Sagittula salina]|uniref:HAD family phosphatase n=1 Tax=Sagittula salina TaxID=2820268 RepID=A0A940MQS2_9RHOB|nr:HAD family phosphatase [Sagittula salina]MBP0484110.1 HAD family phosphatase [Sagittula salina]